MRELVVRGTPRRLDAVLRPVARVVQLAAAGVATLILAWFDAWWWLPAPLVASFLLYEAFFALRGDRPVRVTFGAGGVTLDDRAAGQHTVLRLDEIDAYTLLYRAAPDDPDQIEIATVLSGDDGPRLALSLRVPRASFVPAPEDVDADAMDAVLGGLAGLVRSLAPPDRAVRQIVRDARPVAWLREALPADVRERTCVRAWRGREPRLDDFGHLLGEPDASLRLDGDRAFLRSEAPGRERPLRLAGAALAHREVALIARQNGLPVRVTHDLPLLVLQLEGLGHVAIPAPSADPALPEASLDDDTMHLTGPEGAALIAHLLRHDLVPAARDAVDPFAQARNRPNVIGSAAP